jgi:hypothetical protein
MGVIPHKHVTLLRTAILLLLVATGPVPARADDILFIGNSFTFGGSEPVIQAHGGVPKIFEAIALAKGKQVTTSAVTASGKDWAYHLAQPATDAALQAKTWTWVVLQDFSTRPTQAGSVADFIKDGETFSDRIGKTSPVAGILLYETWPRPPGDFYEKGPGKVLNNPAQMMAELHKSYGDLRDDLAAKNPNRAARVALVGTAFARSETEYPAINLNAADAHHATADGYYLAALVIYETAYHDSAKDAPTQFFNGALTIPPDDAAKLQSIADEVAGGPAK